jgi:hypothetical protein
MKLHFGNEKSSLNHQAWLPIHVIERKKEKRE